MTRENTMSEIYTGAKAANDDGFEQVESKKTPREDMNISPDLKVVFTETITLMEDVLTLDSANDLENDVVANATTMALAQLL